MTAPVDATGLLPAERIALSVAHAQVMRGDDLTPNIAVVCVMALYRITAPQEETEATS